MYRFHEQFLTPAIIIIIVVVIVFGRNSGGGWEPVCLCFSSWWPRCRCRLLERFWRLLTEHWEPCCCWWRVHVCSLPSGPIYGDRQHTHTYPFSPPEPRLWTVRGSKDNPPRWGDSNPGSWRWDPFLNSYFQVKWRKNFIHLLFPIFSNKRDCMIAFSEESGRGKRKSPMCYWVSSIVSSDSSCRISENNVSSQITENELVWFSWVLPAKKRASWQTSPRQKDQSTSWYRRCLKKPVFVQIWLGGEIKNSLC